MATLASEERSLEMENQHHHAFFIELRFFFLHELGCRYILLWSKELKRKIRSVCTFQDIVLKVQALRKK